MAAIAEKVETTGADDEGAGAQFKPLVKLDIIETKTMEEEEEVVFKMRSKLFTFIKEDVYGGEKRTNYWKERGTGDVKLLKHKDHGKTRLLMRQEKTLKICANHLVSPYVELSANVGSDRAWVFTAKDFADETLESKMFCLRFANSENAQKFFDAVEAAKKANAEIMGVEYQPSPKDDDSSDDDDDADESAEIDKAIDARNQRETVRRKSVQAQSALADDDYDSDEEDVDETVSAHVAQTHGLTEGINDLKVGETVCGGFSGKDVADEGVVAAANFAFEEVKKALGAEGPAEFVKVVSAQSQVVAGVNYLLTIETKHADGASKSYEVKIYKPLPHTGKPMELKSHKAL